MRNIRVFIVSVGLTILLTSSWAAAQDAAKPVVQVIIGADGSVKVIDPKTGKDLPSVVTKVAPQAPARLEAQMELLFARDALQQALVQAEKAAKGRKGDAKQEQRIIELEFRIQGHAEKPATLDQKVDRLLQEMAELRRDVNQLKSKLDSKMQGNKGQDAPPPPPGEKKLKFRFEFDQESAKALEELRKKAVEAAKKNEPRAGDRNAELDRILERMIREVEELRQEIRKSKGAPK